MSKGGRPKAPLTLTDDERQKLQTWASRPKSTQRLATRARIVLACAEGLGQQGRRRPAPRQHRDRRQVARAASWRTASKGWPTSPGPGPRARSPTPRSRRSSPGPWRRSPRTPPTGAPAAWPGPSGLSQTAVVRIWHAFGLEAPPDARRSSSPPTRSSSRRSVTSSACTWARRRTPSSCASTRRARSRRWTAPSRCCRWPRAGRAADPRLRPPRHDLAVRGPGRGHRAGDRQVLPAAPAAGVPQVPQRDRRARSPRKPGSRSTSSWTTTARTRRRAVKRWFVRHPEYHLHFTPTSGSWLNQVERFFAEITERRDPPWGVPQRGGVGEGDHGIPGGP